MKIEDIIKGGRLIDKLKSLEYKAAELKKNKDIGSIILRENQSGAPEYSYDVRFTEDEDFMLMVKSMFQAHIEVMIQKLKKEIENL